MICEPSESGSTGVFRTAQAMVIPTALSGLNPTGPWTKPSVTAAAGHC
jgi:hypothetical protein